MSLDLALDQTLTAERPAAARDWHTIARMLDSTLLKPDTTRD